MKGVSSRLRIGFDSSKTEQKSNILNNNIKRKGLIDIIKNIRIKQIKEQLKVVKTKHNLLKRGEKL